MSVRVRNSPMPLQASALGSYRTLGIFAAFGL